MGQEAMIRSERLSGAKSGVIKPAIVISCLFVIRCTIFYRKKRSIWTQPSYATQLNYFESSNQTKPNHITLTKTRTNFLSNARLEDKTNKVNFEINFE